MVLRNTFLSSNSGCNTAIQNFKKKLLREDLQKTASRGEGGKGRAPQENIGAPANKLANKLVPHH